MARRPSGQTPVEAFKWYMPEDPPLIIGFPPEEQPCWDWRGEVMNKGYGIIRFNSGLRILAHRMSHVIFTGGIPDELGVLHSCDRPICVQPAHLHTGTQKVNMDEAIERERWNPAQNAGRDYGERHHLAKLTEDDVRLIRSRVLSQRKLAAIFGVTRKTIEQVQSGRTWRHVR